MKKYREKQDYYEGLDKRTAEYKSYKRWKEEFEKEQEDKPEGLGDVVEIITKATGIKAMVDFFTPEGKDCGCEERRVKWNTFFPMNKPKCLEEDEYNYLVEFFKTNKRLTGSITFDEKIRIYDINNRLFSQKLKASNCPSCIKNIVKKLYAVLDSYK